MASHIPFYRIPSEVFLLLYVEEGLLKSSKITIVHHSHEITTG